MMLFTSPNSEGTSKSILIVDDDEMLVELLSMMFDKYDFKVFKSKNICEILMAEAEIA
jgi:ActR/RegA family two-component response regulator